MNNERSDAIRKLLESDGWKLVEEWLNGKETEIVNAIKNDVMRLKWSEKDKWFPFYSGEANIIRALRAYIEGERTKEERQDKIREFRDKIKAKFKVKD